MSPTECVRGSLSPAVTLHGNPMSSWTPSEIEHERRNKKQSSSSLLRNYSVVPCHVQQQHSRPPLILFFTNSNLSNAPTVAIRIPKQAWNGPYISPAITLTLLCFLPTCGCNSASQMRLTSAAGGLIFHPFYQRAEYRQRHPDTLLI